MKDLLALDSLYESTQNQKPSKGLIIYTDKGSRYTGSKFYEYTIFTGFTHNQSRRRNSYDAAVMESFFKIFKHEVLYQHHFKTKAEAISETIDYLENYYNNERIHSILVYLTPVKFEKIHY